MGSQELRNRFVSVQAAAAYLGLSPSSFRRLVSEGRVPAVRERGRLLIPQAWLEGRIADALADVTARARRREAPGSAK